MKQIIKSASKVEPIYISTQAERTAQERTCFSLFIHSPGAARQQRRLPSNLHGTLVHAPFFFVARGCERVAASHHGADARHGA